MKRTAVILTLVGMVSLLGASDVRGGGGALILPKKTTGPGLTAAIVIDVTLPPGAGNPSRGLTSIRVQKAGASAATFFYSSQVNGFVNECIHNPPFDLVGTTADRFVGFMDGWVDSPILNQLLVNFGNPSKAAITSIDNVACGPVTYQVNGVAFTRVLLSFSAVIGFDPSLP